MAQEENFLWNEFKQWFVNFGPLKETTNPLDGPPESYQVYWNCWKAAIRADRMPLPGQN